MNIFWHYFSDSQISLLVGMNSSTCKDRNVRSNAWNELSDVFNKESKQKKKTSAFDSISIFSL